MFLTFGGVGRTAALDVYSTVLKKRDAIGCSHRDVLGLQLRPVQLEPEFVSDSGAQVEREPCRLLIGSQVGKGNRRLSITEGYFAEFLYLFQRLACCLTRLDIEHRKRQGGNCQYWRTSADHVASNLSSCLVSRQFVEAFSQSPIEDFNGPVDLVGRDGQRRRDPPH